MRRDSANARIGFYTVMPTVALGVVIILFTVILVYIMSDEQKNSPTVKSATPNSDSGSVHGNSAHAERPPLPPPEATAEETTQTSEGK
jgi:hypothetical protein